MSEQYIVNVYEKWYKEYSVVADSEDEALRLVEQMMQNDEEPDDFDFLGYDEPWAVATRRCEI